MVQSKSSPQNAPLFSEHDFGGSNDVLDGRAVLITGATGSFGQAFVKSILRNGAPSRVIVYSRDELKQYEMEQALREGGFDLKPVRFFLGDVRDQPRLEMALNGIDTVIHAAALKQVPAAEYNPFECINTNVVGAENVVRASMRMGVKKVLALSTDKACSPANLYGASKLASDKIFIAANNISGRTGSRFAVVRYGNVMGSRGSVVPFFRRLMQEKSEFLPITDDRMTRFWISLDQGISFVKSCLGQMVGGELFVPKIPSVKVVDLAAAIAPDMEQKIVGIRPGEKLHEAMITEHDARHTVELDDRYVILPPSSENAPERFAHYGTHFVDEHFNYTSDTNPHWLNVEEVRDWLGQLT